MPYCLTCGCEYVFGAERCPRCGQVLPVPPPTCEESPDGRVFADIRFRRAFAGFVDLSIATVIGVLVFRVLLVRFVVRARLLLLLISIAAMLAPALYLMVKDSLGGKSIGKLLVGLTVVNPRQRRRAGFVDSVLRNLVFGFAAVPIVGWIVTLGIVGVAAVQVLAGRPRRIGEGLTDALVLDDRAAEAEL